MTIQPDPNIQLVTVFRTSDPGLVGLVKSILQNAGIDHFLRGETLGNVRGWGGIGAFDGPAEFQVRQSDASSASQLLAKLGEPPQGMA